MANFDLYAPTLKKWEGGWANDPDDRGGATMMGVTIATFRRFFGAHRTEDELRHITPGQWRIVMKTFWDKCKGDEIRNQSIAEIFVDWYVNAGVNAIKRVQKVFGLRADGIVGPLTLAALNRDDSEVVFNRIKDSRISYYRAIVEANPSQKKFLNGWLRRTYSFEFSNDS